MSQAGVEIALLGPVECRVDGTPLAVSSRKQRAILAVLALRAGEVVSTDRLIEALWGESPPASARNSLEAHVSRLRRLLAQGGAPPDALRTRSPGYVLTTSTDLASVERLRAESQAAPERSVELLTEAVSLWRGSPLADLRDEPFATTEAARLEELELVTREDLARSRLEHGDSQQAVLELEALVAEHPLRERLRELLMLAYYRSGRQADALELYRETRILLREELGLEPSPELRALEQAILRHDAAVRPPAAASPTERAEASPSPRRTRRRSTKIALVVVLAAAAVALGLFLTGRSSAHRLTHPDALGKHLLASIPSPLPACCAFGFGGVWVVGHHDQTVEKIDPARKKVVASYPIAGYQAEAPLMAAGSLWVPAAGEAKFVRFDPVRKRVVATYPTTAAEIAWGYNSIWATTRDHQLLRINLRTNRIVSRLRLSAGVNDFDDGIAVGYGSIWITNTDNATLLRVDPSSNRIVGRLTGFGSTDSWMPVTTGDGSVWLYRITGKQSIVYRIDPYTNQIVKRIPVGHRNVAWPNGYIDDAGGYVWTCDAGSTMSQIDPRSNRVVGWYDLPETCQEVAYGLGSIWTALYDASRVYRIDPGSP